MPYAYGAPVPQGTELDKGHNMKGFVNQQATRVCYCDTYCILHFLNVFFTTQQRKSPPLLLETAVWQFGLFFQPSIKVWSFVAVAVAILMADMRQF